MLSFDQPKKAVYLHKSPNFDGTFTTNRVKVLVTGESANSYFVKLLEYTTTKRPNDTMWVRKRNIVMTSAERPKYWWQNL